jgi:DNA-directed RNA polymerase specialized sigma24 family protein
MIAMKELKQKEQVLFLRGVGYDISEIAEILDVTGNYVSVTLYEAKQERKRPGAKGKK